MYALKVVKKCTSIPIYDLFLRFNTKEFLAYFVYDDSLLCLHEQHDTATIYGHPGNPACLADYKDRRAVLLSMDTPKHLERFMRDVCVQAG